MFDLKNNHRLLFLALVFALLVAPSTFAQTVTGTIQGTVSDARGAVVPGAEVVIRNLETGQERNVKTGGEGVYIAPFLPLGKYTVTASSAGFNKVAKENIEVTLNKTLVINFTLQPSSVTEAVVVTSDAAPINTTNAEIKGSLNAQEIIEKPTFNQGSFLTLAETFTGYQENPTSGQNNPTASSGSSINFNGTARAARPSRSTASITTTPPKTRIARACRCRRSKSFRSSPTTSARSLVAVTARWSWSRQSQAQITFTARSTSITTTAP